MSRLWKTARIAACLGVLVCAWGLAMVDQYGWIIKDNAIVNALTSAGVLCGLVSFTVFVVGIGRGEPENEKGIRVGLRPVLHAVYFECLAVLMASLYYAVWAVAFVVSMPNYLELTLRVVSMAVCVMVLCYTFVWRLKARQLTQTLFIVQFIRYFRSMPLSSLAALVFAACAVFFIATRRSVYIPYSMQLILVSSLFALIAAGTASVQAAKIAERIARMAHGERDREPEPDWLPDTLKQIDSLNAVMDAVDSAVQRQMASERLKTELIANVSHDIKTPLTSIINYVDLMKKESVQNGTLREYLDVLDRKSQRLKTLLEDLLEASKAGTGNITAEMRNMNISELLAQVAGDFDELFQNKNLELIISAEEEENWARADGRLLSRIMENLFSNAAKYSAPNSRVYASIVQEAHAVVFTMKNVSEEPLNISADELMERFVRGDRARNTEGSGLGLYIAQSLAETMSASLKLTVNGDLFTAEIRLPAAHA